MTIVASDDTPLVKGSDVPFVMLHGTERVHCVVSREALEDAARIQLTETNGRELELFEKFRARTEAIATRKFVAGAIEADGTIIIRTADLNP